MTYIKKRMAAPYHTEFPKFPCVGNCSRNVGIKGNKCRHCKDKDNFGKKQLNKKSPETQAEQYVDRKYERRVRNARDV